MAQLDEEVPSGMSTPALAPGEVLAGRYRVAAFRGQGAVGEVYAADDLELGEAVAIKVLRPEIARDERVLQRFKREIQLARRVSHPNVCRVFDLVYDVRPGDAGGAPRHVFLTMELLSGETLEERLAREGRLTTAETLPIIGHVAAALTAAHDVGVVHRDLKGGNIFLVPTPSGPRAVVTDFGLAWSPLHTGNQAASLTATGELVGSPAYMAPEQVRGEEATPATDIYALGVVIFEMITGELPFVGKSAFYTALKRLQEPAPSPRLQVADLDPAWEETILRCLAREPADRFPSARHVVRSLGKTQAERDATSPLHLLSGRTRRRLRRRGLLGAAGLASVLLGAGWWITWTVPSSPPAEEKPQELAVPASPRPTVAVLGFSGPEGTGPDLGVALAETLPRQLAAAETLRVIPAEVVDLARRELAIDPAAGLPAETLDRLRARLGMDFLVSGSWTAAADGRLRFDIVVQDARIRETIAAFSEAARPEAFPAFLTALGERLRARLGADPLPAAAAEAARAALPASLATADLLARGLGRLRRFDAPAAREVLREAAAAEPDSPFVHTALAAAWGQSGELENARRAARRAWELARPLSPVERRQLEALYSEAVPDWPKAIALYRELLAATPDDLETGLRLAAAQRAAGRGTEAVETLERLRRLPPPAGDDPRLLLAEAAAAGARSVPAVQLDLAERAVRSGEALSAPLLVAEAHLQAAWAHQKVGDFAAAAESVARAERLAAGAGHRPLTATAIRTRALLRYRQEGWEEASPLYDQALALFRQAGDQGGVAATLKEIGLVRTAAGDLAAGEESIRASLALMRRTGDRRGMADTLHNLGAMVQQRGDIPGARTLFEQALKIERATGYERGEAKTLQGLAYLAGLEGRLDEAVRHYQAALALERANGDRLGIATVLHNLANVQFERGDLNAARRCREEALAIARDIEDQDAIGRGLRGLADLDRHQGKLTSARALYEQALAIYRREKLQAAEVSLLDDLGVTLTLQGEYGKAIDAFAQSLAYCREKKLFRQEAAVLVHRGRAHWGRGDLAAAKADFEAALKASAEGGGPKTAAEARAALALVHRDSGDLATARREAEAALAAFREHKSPKGEADALFALATVLALQGDLGTARRNHEQARVIRTRLGEHLAVAESERALAALDRPATPGS